MAVPFYDLSIAHKQIRAEVEVALMQVYDSGSYILGKHVQTFEQSFAAWLGAEHCVGVGNGLDALVIALQALNIGEGDEVIVPANTFIATWLAVSRVGAVPVPVEPLLDTYNINVSEISEKITERTKAIIPVHLYGQAANMEAVMQIADKHSLYVIEDFAQSQGATWAGKTTGTFGHISATSFYPGKNIGAMGDAGAIVTSNVALYNKALLLRNYGSPQKYVHQTVGNNTRLDEIQAALLNIKLKYLNDWNQQRQQIAQQYYHLLSGVGDIILPVIDAKATSVYHQFVVRTTNRNALQQHLVELGIGTIIHYPVPPHLQPAYASLGYKKGDFPITELIADTCLSLPIYPGINAAQVNEVANAIQQFFKSR